MSHHVRPIFIIQSEISGEGKEIKGIDELLKESGKVRVYVTFNAAYRKTCNSQRNSSRLECRETGSGYMTQLGILALSNLSATTSPSAGLTGMSHYTWSKEFFTIRCMCSSQQRSCSSENLMLLLIEQEADLRSLNPCAARDTDH
ncbi:hypothetical protein AAY473_036040, partial [Plecturocebus cupreus]